jgi:phosphoribosylformimino-5-aminoimidazole carboxamide ribotide isomerase
MKLIPAIDLRGGKCVRLYQGDYDQQTDYSDNPIAVARDFEQLGCPDLHIVDLDGARSGEQDNRMMVTAICAATRFDVQLGGGIRDAEVIERWLEAGVRRCVVGSMAVNEPDTVQQWMADFGRDRIVLALDVRIDDDGTPMLATHGWTEDSGVSLWQCVDAYLEHGLRHVLCTDIGRDGAMSGPNVDLYGTFVERYPGVHLQASGGVRDISDLVALRAAGAHAAISGRALLDGRITAEEVESFLHDA